MKSVNLIVIVCILNDVIFLKSCSSRGYPADDSILFCPYNTLVDELCPAGSYCPTPFEKYECPVGSFCSVGSAKSSLCAGGSLACPNKGMQTANAGAVFLIYFIGFLIIYFSLNILVQKILNNRQQLVTDAVSHQSSILAKGK